MKFRILCIFVFLSTHIQLFSQNLKIGQIAEKTEIISEKNDITILGERSDRIFLNVKKELHVKINDSIGLNYYKKIALPELFDPTYINHSAEVRNLNSCLDKIVVLNFSGEIKGRNSENEKIKYTQLSNVVRSVSIDDRFDYYSQPIMLIENLKIGDELFLSYTYQVPYEENVAKLMSYRIFFNSNTYKKHYTLNINRRKDLSVDFSYYCNSKPDSVIEKNKIVNYYWTKTDLFGCIDEPGSRPYLSLPNIVFNIKPYSLLYTLPFSFEERYTPFYAIAAYYRERSKLTILKSVIQGKKDIQMVQLNDFLKYISKDIKKDSTGYSLISKMQSEISDGFVFNSDTNVFRKDDLHLDRLGDCAQGRVLKEVSKYNLYAGLLSLLGFDFYSAYVIDKRYGVISEDMVKPMYDSDYLLGVVLKNNKMQLIYPKSSNYGYYLSEMPFYFENTKVRLVHFTDFLNEKAPMKEDFRAFISPKSQMNENIRKNNVSVEIDIDKQIALFNTKITLLGQFSTLIRGLYKNDVKTKTVNELYNKKIFDFNPNAKLLSKKVEIVDNVFPFKAIVNTNYSCDSILKKGNSSYSLDMKNWFNHIIYNDFDIKNRQLDFYSDFCGNDVYSYMIKFNKDVELLTAIAPVEITNDFGSLIIQLKQIDKNTVMINSNFIVKSEKVKRENTDQIKAIYDKIQDVNNLKIEFKVLN